MRKSLFVLLAGVLTSCGSVNYFQIETYNPSEVTFPKTVNEILVVNHSVPQPANAGYRSQVLGEEEKAVHAEADSALYDACRSLGEAMMRSSFFSDVLIYNDTLRTDSLYYSDQKMTEEETRRVCERTGADAVVALDRLIFRMDRDVVPFSGSYFMGKVNVQMRGVFRAYLPDRNQPLATVLVEDSVQFIESAESLRILNDYLPEPEEALRVSARYLGTKVSENFVPHWTQEDRWYYTSMSARWKEASAYASKGDWESAGQRWFSLYEKAKPGVRQAKLASNLALAAEMRGEFVKALEWATKSREAFVKALGEEADESKLLLLYEKALGERVNANRKLNAQFGEE